MAAVACLICTHKYRMETSGGLSKKKDKCEEEKKTSAPRFVFSFLEFFVCVDSYFFCKLLLYFSSFK